jgi:hypothetical protein
MLRNQTISQCVLALLISLLAFTAQADSLSDTTIRAFIASMQDVQTLENQYAGTDQWPDDTEDNTDSMPDISRLFSDGLKEMKAYPVYAQFEKLIKNRGFSSAEQWASVGDRVFHAMMAIEMQSESPDMAQDVAEAMVEIENNPDMTAEQKAQIKAMMAGAMGVAQSVSKAPPADIKAVRPHMDALRTLMDSD